MRTRGDGLCQITTHSGSPEVACDTLSHIHIFLRDTISTLHSASASSPTVVTGWSSTTEPHGPPCLRTEATSPRERLGVGVEGRKAGPLMCLLHWAFAPCSARFSHTTSSPPKPRWTDVLTPSKLELWFRVALLWHDGGKRELRSGPAWGILPSSDVGGREPSWVVGLALPQACISDSDLGSSLRHTGWLWGRKGGT